MISCVVDVGENEGTPEDHLRVREQKDQEDESFEIQLPVRTDAESIAHCQKKIPQHCRQPVQNSGLLRTEELECHRPC